MTDQNFLNYLAAKQTNEMALLEPSIDDLDLTTLPDRLDDQTLERVALIGKAGLPALPPCDSKTFSQCLRMMLAVLPRRGADDLSGELFVAAYERQLGTRSHDAITYLCDEAIRTLKWFPTVADCNEILASHRRNDEAVTRKAEAMRLVRLERRQREQEERLECAANDWRSSQMHPSEIQDLNPTLIQIGIKCGALVRDDDGNVKAAPREIVVDRANPFE